MNIRVFSTEAPLKLLNNYLLILAILNLLIWFGFSVDCFLVTNLGVNVIQDYFFFFASDTTVKALLSSCHPSLSCYKCSAILKGL